MDANRRAAEFASRCVALVIYHQHTIHRPLPIKGRILAEIRGVMADARKEGVAAADVSAEALSELSLRYDPETARRHHAEFIGGPDDQLPSNLVRV